MIDNNNITNIEKNILLKTINNNISLAKIENNTNKLNLLSAKKSKIESIVPKSYFFVFVYYML
jgi:hypothetical protein